MKKINNKGFVLAEAVVVGVFILSLFTFLFVNIIPLIGKYEAVEQYDTVDATYNTNLIRMIMLENTNYSSLLTLSVNGTYTIYDSNSFCNKFNNTGEDAYSKSFCKKLLGKTFLDVKKIIITKFRLSSLKSLVKAADTRSDFTREEREYILSLDSYTQPSLSSYDNYHRIIVEYNDGSFGNLEIKK